MSETDYLSDEDIRKALLSRANEFCELTGTSISSLGKAAVNDPAVLSQVRTGRNFTIDTYRRLMAWLDANWPTPAQIKALKKARNSAA